MSRLDNLFAELEDAGRAALIPFIMGGDPNLKFTAQMLKELPKAGADIIEIGVPFSDPMADGPTIAAAGKRALEKGTTLAKILGVVKEFRKTNNETPIILMGYYNLIYRFGDEKFCKAAAVAGVDGVIIVDLPLEEEREIKPFLQEHKIDLIRLVAPTTTDKRMTALMKSASGFVYYIAVAGVTGVKSANFRLLKNKVMYARHFTQLPIVVGFGIKTPEQAREVAHFADAVVVGSALVDIIHKKKSVKTAAAFVRTLAGAVRNY